MAAILRLLASVLLLSFMVTVSLSQGEEEEEFSEELLLKPLADRKVLAHFHFQSRAPPTRIYGHHHRLFPKALYQLVQKYRIREMELSFTQGRWNYERWGGFDPISSSNAKPPGVELWAVFDVPLDQVDASWKNLTHTLSGLFCASINFLESSTAYSAPDWGFRPFSGSLRYGSLPREAVCTENLTPWLKLLPCRDKAGLAALMDRPSIYRGFYHSQRLRLTSTEFGSTEVESGIAVDQTLTVVLQPSTSRRASITYSGGSVPQPSWSLSSIFGRKVSGRCVLAKSSNVFIQVERGLMSELKNLHTKDEGSWVGNIPFEKYWNNSGFELSIAPSRVIKEVNSLHDETPTVLYEYLIDNYSNSEPFDLGFTWKLPVIWSSPQAPLRASRFLMGSGNERGAIAISLKATEASEGLCVADTTENSCMVRFNVFQVVPWYVKVYFHTLQVFVDEKPQSFMDVIERMRVSPSEDKVSPGLMEMAFKLPCHVKSVIFTLEFDKGFLHIDEYPPDANQGFDVPSAVISFPDFHASMHFLKDDSLNRSPMLSKFQERSPVLCYTEVLLVPLTTPDFSMPYNVITITCTVFALYFGTLLNVLRRRIGEEERLLKRKDAKIGRLRLLLSKLFAKLRGKSWEPTKTESASSSSLNSSKLFLVILVAGIAVGCQYYFQ